MMNTFERVAAAIHDHTARIAVIGQGYVGLPLAMSLSRRGYQTFGIDINSKRVEQLAGGKSYILDVSDSEVEYALQSGHYRPTEDFRVIAQSDVVVICVPTPLRKSKDPDVSYILSAVSSIKVNMHAGMLIILESTTYPGTTDELIVAELESAGYIVGEDFFVCFSPERVDPGNPVYKTENTPKVVGGVTERCTTLGKDLYGRVMENIVPVSSARVAEMVKLLENTFRAVNIGLVNELALMCERMNINIWEVVDAAATKPFGFMPFYPGPGIGGHCIPLDPMYLSWKAKMHDFYNKFIELASDINGNMPRHVLTKVAEALNLVGKSVSGSTVLILGMAYKRDIDDLRESPSLEIFRLLRLMGATVQFHDPHATTFHDEHDGTICHGVELNPSTIGQYDCVVLATNHTAFDYGMIAREAQLILDTRNAFKHYNAPHIIKLGAATPTPAEWRRTVAETPARVTVHKS